MLYKLKYVLLKIILTIFVHVSFAQIEINNQIIFSGDSLERTIWNLSPPSGENHIETVGSHILNRINWAGSTVTGDTLLLSIPLYIESYVNFLYLNFVSPIDLDPEKLHIGLNQLSPKKALIQGSSGNYNKIINANEIISSVFVNDTFLIINGVSNTCPPGFVSINSNSCIQVFENDSMSFFNAAQFCYSLGGRICSANEWVSACRNNLIQDSTGNFEWLDDAGNFSSTINDALVSVAGETSCINIWNYNPVTLRAFRCCYSKK
jgi:hypothetical protein